MNSMKKPNRFLKLSLKKNRLKQNEEKQNRSSDVIVLDETFNFDKLRMENMPKHLSAPKIYSPIVIDDSCESSQSEDASNTKLDKVVSPSKTGNVSFNMSIIDTSIPENHGTMPSIGGWSPAQSIITATPRNDSIPSTPRDIANESLEQCSIKKIQQSQKKLLNDLYGETWKSIPQLFKTVSHNLDNMDGISKKLQFNDDDESDKENVRHNIKLNKELYLTGSDAKRKMQSYRDSEKKSKKKLYTETLALTPDVTKKVRNIRNVKTTVKKGMSVTELVQTMGKDGNETEKTLKTAEVLPKSKTTDKVLNTEVLPKTINIDNVLAKKVDNLVLTPKESVNRLTFMGSLADNVPSWRCHIEAIQYRDNYKTLREQLTRRLYVEFNRVVFNDAFDADMPIVWDSKLRSTAGTTTNRLIKNAKGDRIRTSSVKLSTKVVDAPQRLRDTLIHELCHAATWLVDAEIKAGHGPLWKKWASRALRLYPELGEISRCHDLEIHFKYSYKCTQCGYCIKRHSKSIDITKKACGYCRGTFEIIVNKKNKDGVVISTPARKGTTNDFANYVKENYGSLKSGRTHAQVMKVLGEQFRQNTPSKVS